MDRRYLILDNGSFTVKSGGTQKGSVSHPNCVSKPKYEKRSYVGSSLQECRNYFGLLQTRPFERGYLTNWGLQKEIWDTIIPSESQDLNNLMLLITEPMLNLPNIQQSYEEVLFEEYGVGSLLRSTSAQFASRLLSNALDCYIVVDSGYSFTHIIPFINGQPVLLGIRRLNVGGKVLTNYLKETVSFRYYNMMQETYLMNQIKEACCYVALDFHQELLAAKQGSSRSQSYVLPDFSVNKAGYVFTEGTLDPDDQVLKLNNERFTIPELMFNPSIAGISQAGLPEAIAEAIQAASSDPAVQELFYANIRLFGGNVKFRNFSERLQHELRHLAPEDAKVNVSLVSEEYSPELCPWQGAVQMCMESPDLVSQAAKTKQQYMEEGRRTQFF